MKKALIISGLLLVGSLLFATGPGYGIRLIPESLREGADAVVRLYEAELQMTSPSEATYSVHKVITILHPRKDYLAEVVIGYDSFEKLGNIEAMVYDASGKLVRKLKRKEIVDGSQYSGTSIADDNRYKAFDLTQRNHPYTIELRYTTEYDGIGVLPSFWPITSTRLSVQHAEYKVRYQAANPLRYFTQNMGPPSQSSEGEFEQLYWQVDNLSVVRLKEYGPDFGEVAPWVKIAPTRFEIEGYAGDMSSWKSYGDFQYKLNETAGQVSEEVKAEIRQLVADAQTREDSIQRVYEYMQDRTRYVSIQLGIGGWKPFKASFVHEKQYGDCKALSYYQQALLESIGITSHCALIWAGAEFRKVNPAISGPQFNHVILCVPTETDSIWLECTSQRKPMGYMGTFTDNRYSLLVTPEGGKLVRTPSYGPEENQQIYTGSLSLTENGMATGEMELRFEGQAYSFQGLNFVLYKDEKTQREWLLNRLDWSTWQIETFAFEQQKAMLPSVQANLQVQVNDLGSRTGKRLFVKLPPRRTSFSPAADTDRSEPLILARSSTAIDSLTLDLPAGAEVEFLPPPTQVNAPFGTYETSYVEQEGEILYVRKRQLVAGTYEPAVYPEWVSFWSEVSKAERQQLVLQLP